MTPHEHDAEDLVALRLVLKHAERACIDDNTDMALDYVRDAIRHVAAWSRPTGPAAPEAMPACVHGHTARTVGCVSCYLLWPVEPPPAPEKETSIVSGLKPLDWFAPPLRGGGLVAHTDVTSDEETRD
jgi:hypothetical protein